MLLRSWNKWVKAQDNPLTIIHTYSSSLTKKKWIMRALTSYVGAVSPPPLLIYSTMEAVGDTTNLKPTLSPALVRSTILFLLHIGADSLVTKLTDRITASSSHRLIVAHLPLILVCIEGLGSLAEKFPMLAKQSGDCLREFLTHPSRLLIRLNRVPQRGNKGGAAGGAGGNNTLVPALFVTQSDRCVQ